MFLKYLNKKSFNLDQIIKEKSYVIQEEYTDLNGVKHIKLPYEIVTEHGIYKRKCTTDFKGLLNEKIEIEKTNEKGYSVDRLRPTLKGKCEKSEKIVAKYVKRFE